MTEPTGRDVRLHLTPTEAAWFDEQLEAANARRKALATRKLPRITPSKFAALLLLRGLFELKHETED